MEVCGGILICGLVVFVVVAVATEDSLSGSRDGNALANLAMFFEAMLVMYGMLVWAWVCGSKSADETFNKAVEMMARAKTTMSDSRAIANDALAEKHKAEQSALKANQVVTATLTASHLKAIEITRELPLADRIAVAFAVGKYPGEQQVEYESRRAALIGKRSKQWQHAERWGHRLLPIVARQAGLCGDPSRDKTKKGCGCYLYALPPTAVHLDHIIPRKQGGPNTEDNIQALCSYCNASAGAKYEEGDP